MKLTKKFRFPAIEERQAPKGQVEVIAFDAEGREVERVTDHNLVVTNGRQRLAKLLSGEVTDTIEYFRIGTGTTQPVASNNAMETPVNISSGVTQKAIDNYEYPTANSVRFNMSLSVSQGNGNAITEYGLFTSDDVMFARAVLPAINKSSAFSYIIKWTITF